MKINELIKYINEGKLDKALVSLYGEGQLDAQRNRYTEAVKEFSDIYGADRDVNLFSVPGRSEISGNHTDHQRGCVIAAAIDLDIVAVASVNGTDKVNVKSKGFPEDSVSCDPESPDEKLFGSSASLLSGMCHGFTKRGYKVCGFDAYTTSNVFKGSGISSSAAFEVMIGNILNHFVNGGSISAPVIAEIAQYAENVFFGKPCGLMDQTACAVGGFSYIDFGDPSAAKIEKLDFDLSGIGYSLCITNTGGNHADLTDDYAAVPAEMKGVAKEFGLEVLRGLTRDELLSKASELREKVGDRAILRAFHFIGENERVPAIAQCLRSNDAEGFFNGIKESGRSSFMWLQNVYTTKNVGEQGLTLALAVSEYALKNTSRTSASRVHGGGFAGTIQAFVPNEDVSSYKEQIEAVFGAGSCSVLKVRPDGAIKVL